MTYEDYQELNEMPDDDFLEMLESHLNAEHGCSFCHQDCIEDVDCASCGLKFWIRSCLYSFHPVAGKKAWPVNCERCQKGLPPLYEY